MPSIALIVSTTGQFYINYTETGHRDYLEGGDCKSEYWQTNGTIHLSDSDFASYGVQNSYQMFIPLAPGIFSLDGNFTQNVNYNFVFLSSSNLYKYYSAIDSQAAGHIISTIFQS